MFLAVNRAKYFIILLFLACVPYAYGVGFGEIKVYSFLGEPLYAEVAVTGYQDVDARLLQANLAGAKDFMRAGIERPYFLTSLAFQVITYNRDLYIVIRTNKVVQAPYIEFLLELSWPSGNLVKDFTILLDPPPDNLNNATRPKGMGQLADEEAVELSSALNPIQQQVDLQKAKEQKAQAEEDLADVVRISPNKFADQTFDNVIPENAATGGLVPDVVPEVEDKQKEYQKQRSEFEQTESAKNQTKQQPKTLLQNVISDLQEFQQDDDEAEQNVKSLLGSTDSKPDTKSESAQAAGTEPAPVDFNEVIKPQKPIKKPLSEPSIQSSVPDEPPKKTNYMYLGIILSLLLVAAGIVFAIRSGKLKTSKQDEIHDDSPIRQDTKEPEENVKENFDDQSVLEEIEQFTIDEDIEEIELEDIQTSKPKEYEIHTDQPTEQPVVQPTEQPVVQPIEQPVVQPIEQPVVQPTEQPVVQPTEQPVVQPTEQPVVQPIPQEDFKVEDFAKELEDIETKEVDIEYDIDSQKIDPVITNIEELKSILPEETKSTELQEEINVASKDEETKHPQEHIATENEVAGIVNESVIDVPEENIEGPTLYKEVESDLKLSEEGATLVAENATPLDNSDSMQIKIDLAKQYIEAGDKQAAKDLLHEVVDGANDELKLQAQLILGEIE